MMYLLLLIIFISSGYSEVLSLLWADHGLDAFCGCCSMFTTQEVVRNPEFRLTHLTLAWMLDTASVLSTLPLFVPSCLYLVFAQIFFITSSWIYFCRYFLAFSVVSSDRIHSLKQSVVEGGSGLRLQPIHYCHWVNNNRNWNTSFVLIHFYLFLAPCSKSVCYRTGWKNF